MRFKIMNNDLCAKLFAEKGKSLVSLVNYLLNFIHTSIILF